MVGVTLRALVDGERDPTRLAESIKGRLRAKLSALAEAGTRVPPITRHLRSGCRSSPATARNHYRVLWCASR